MPRNKGDIATGILGGLLLGCVAGTVALRSPILLGIPAGLFGLTMAGGSIYRHCKHELTVSDYSIGLDDYLTDIEEFTVGLIQKAEPATAPIERVLVRSLPEPIQQRLAAQVSELDKGWLDQDFIEASKAVVGPKGSGKSLYLALESIEFYQAHPDGHLTIIDKHYDSEESLWLPGMPREQLEERILVKRPKEGLNLLREFREEMESRVTKGKRGGTFYKIIIDEWEGFAAGLSDDEKTEALSIITQCEDEWRKFNGRVTVGMHSVKKGRTGIDSSVLMQMNVLLMGNAIADTTAVLPADFDQKKLTAERNRVASLPGGKYACIVRAGSEPPSVRVMPEIDLSPYQVALVTPQDWLEANQDGIDEAIAQGVSLRKLTERYGIRRDDSDERYTALKTYINKEQSDEVNV